MHSPVIPRVCGLCLSSMKVPITSHFKSVTTPPATVVAFRLVSWRRSHQKGVKKLSQGNEKRCSSRNGTTPCTVRISPVTLSSRTKDEVFWNDQTLDCRSLSLLWCTKALAKRSNSSIRVGQTTKHCSWCCIIWWWLLIFKPFFLVTRGKEEVVLKMSVN